MRCFPPSETKRVSPRRNEVSYAFFRSKDPFFCSEEIPKNVLVRCKRNPCDPSFDGRKGSYARIRACIRSESWFVRLRRTWRGSISYPLSLGWGIPTGEDSPSLCIAEEEGSGAWDPPQGREILPRTPISTTLEHRLGSTSLSLPFDPCLPLPVSLPQG